MVTISPKQKPRPLQYGKSPVRRLSPNRPLNRPNRQPKRSLSPKSSTRNMRRLAALGGATIASVAAASYWRRKSQQQSPPQVPVLWGQPLNIEQEPFIPSITPESTRLYSNISRVKRAYPDAINKLLGEQKEDEGAGKPPNNKLLQFVTEKTKELNAAMKAKHNKHLVMDDNCFNEINYLSRTKLKPEQFRDNEIVVLGPNENDKGMCFRKKDLKSMLAQAATVSVKYEFSNDLENIKLVKFYTVPVVYINPDDAKKVETFTGKFIMFTKLGTVHNTEHPYVALGFI